MIENPQVGDIVCLNSGSPALTVATTTTTGNPAVVVTWYANPHEVMTTTFSNAALTSTDPNWKP
jgi:uncharacterized protein YodC (DUF2158 family)